MFEFRWKIPSDPAEDIVLRIHSRSGWLGCKQLFCGQQAVFRRGWFEGIETRFTADHGRHDLALRALPIAGSPDWRAALFCDGEELPETTGTPPPRVVKPPKLLAIVVGLTYLLMLMAVVMFPSTVKILTALHLEEAATYSAAQDVAPWIIPFFGTAIVLLGVVSMRKRGVAVFAGLILLEAVLALATSVPISRVALSLQVVLWLVGAAYWPRMR